MGESENVTLQCLRGRLLKQSKPLATGKHPGLTSHRVFGLCSQDSTQS